MSLADRFKATLDEWRADPLRFAETHSDKWRSPVTPVLRSVRRARDFLRPGSQMSARTRALLLTPAIPSDALAASEDMDRGAPASEAVVMNLPVLPKSMRSMLRDAMRMKAGLPTMLREPAQAAADMLSPVTEALAAPVRAAQSVGFGLGAAVNTATNPPAASPRASQATRAGAKEAVTEDDVQGARGRAIGSVLGKRLLKLLDSRKPSAPSAGQQQPWWDGDEKRVRTDAPPANYAETGIRRADGSSMKAMGATGGRETIDAKQAQAAAEFMARREFVARARQTPGGADMMRKQGADGLQLLQKAAAKRLQAQRAASSSKPKS